jgi:hypothetical protein
MKNINNKTRWIIQIILIILAVPVGLALMMLLLVFELFLKNHGFYMHSYICDKIYTIINWSMLMPYYAFSTWIHYLSDKGNNNMAAQYISNRLFIAIFGFLFLIGLWYTVGKNGIGPDFWMFLLPLIIWSIFFTAWLSEVIIRWKQRNKSE